MSINQGEIQEQLRRITAELHALVNLLGEGEPVEPPEVAAKVARRECLQTGVVVPDDEQYRRGLCAAAYQRTLMLLRSKEVSEGELVSQGLLAKPRRTGPSPKPNDKLDEYLATKDDRSTETARRTAQEMSNESEQRTRKRNAKKKG